MEESELEEGEACSYNNDHDDYNTGMDPDIDLSYIDEKLQDVLGHFQKDFEGGVSAENLGAKFGGYGSFLPAYQRSPVISHLRTSPKVQMYSKIPISPKNLHQAGVNCDSTALSSMTQSVNVGSASHNGLSLPSLKASSINDTFNQDVFPHYSESANGKSSNFIDKKKLRFRIRLGPDKLSTGKNTEIYSGLGLDGSPSSSLGESPSESEGMSHEHLDVPFESPTSIIQIMTSIPVIGGVLSPLPDALMHLEEKEKLPKYSGSVPVRMAGPNGSKTEMNAAHSLRGDGNVSGEKKTNSLEKNDFSTETEFKVGSSRDAQSGIGALSRNDGDLDALACEELVSNTLKLPLLSNSHTAVGDLAKVMGRVSDMSKDACKGITREKVSSDCTRDESSGPIFIKEDGRFGNSKSDPVLKVREDRNASCLDKVSGYPRKDPEGGKLRNSVKVDLNLPKGGNVELTDLPKKKAHKKVISQGEEIMRLPSDKEQPSSGGKKKVKASKSHNILNADASKENSRVSSSLVPKINKGSHDGFAIKKDYDEDTKLPKAAEKAEDAYKEIFGDLLELEKEEKQLSSPEMLGKGRLRDTVVVEKGTYFSGSALKERSGGKKINKVSTPGAYPQATSKVTSRPGNGPFCDAASVAAASEDNWVCCDKCQKWRLLPLGRNPNDLPEKWLCSMLDWLPGMNRCRFSQNETTNALIALRQVPALATQNNVQSNPGEAVSEGIFADALNANQKDLRFGMDAMAAGGDKKKHGPKEIPTAADKADPFPSSNSVKKNMQASVRNGSLNDNNPFPGVSEPYFSQPNRQSEFTPERHKHKKVEKHKHKQIEKCKLHENNSSGGFTKGSKLKSRRDSDITSLTGSKKIRTESLLCTDEDCFSDHGDGVGKVGHSSGTGSHFVSSGNDWPRNNERSSSKGPKHDKKDRLKFSAKQPKGQVVASLDNGSMHVETSEAREIVVKKRRMKENQDSEIYPGSISNTGHRLQDDRIFAREEFSENDNKKAKKARVFKCEEKQSTASKGRTDKNGSHTKSQKTRLDPGSNLSHQSMEGVDSLKRDAGCIQPSTAATSSSSKVSASAKSKASFHEAKGSPVESVSSSPMRVENLNKFTSSKKCLVAKDNSCNSDHFGIINPRKSLDGENRVEGNRLGKVKKEKSSEMVHHGSHESSVHDFPDKGLSHLSGVKGEAHSTPSSDIGNHHFTNGDANQIGQNFRYHSKPTTLDRDLNVERQTENNYCADGSEPRKSGKGSSLHSTDTNQNSSSKFGVSNFKISGPIDALQDHQTSSKVKPRHKIKPQDKFRVDFDENRDRYLDKDSSGKSVNESSRRESHLNFDGNDAGDIKLDAYQTSTPNQCLLQNCNGERSSKRSLSHETDKVEMFSRRGTSLSAEPSERVQNGAIYGLSEPDSGSHNENRVNNLPFEASEAENVLKAPRQLRNPEHRGRNQHIIPRHSTANVHKVGDLDAPSPVRRDLTSHAASLIKEAQTLKHTADRLKNSGSNVDSIGLYFEAALKFLHGASLFECSGGESRHGESRSMDIYGSTAKLCEFCAHEYEKCKDMAHAALAYKCMEVAYFRVIYSKRASANKDRRELQTALHIGESPSSSASDIDNLNQPIVDKIPLPKGVSPPQGAGNPVLAARNRSHFVSLLDFAQDAIYAMEATRKSQIAFEAAKVSLAGGQCNDRICSIKRALDFNFQDVEELLRLVRLAVEAISH